MTVIYTQTLNIRVMDYIQRPCLLKLLFKIKEFLLIVKKMTSVAMEWYDEKLTRLQ